MNTVWHRKSIKNVIERKLKEVSMLQEQFQFVTHCAKLLLETFVEVSKFKHGIVIFFCTIFQNVCAEITT
jgi:hypothetical protein